jgi:hypothetical protein
MKRKPTAGSLVLEKMNYSNPGIVSKWKSKFPSKELPKPIKAARKAPAQKNDEKPQGPALRFIGKAPIVFRLERKDNPADFERIAFVVKACSEDKPGLNVLYVEQAETGSRLVASDGVRLHVAEISQKIKGGSYKAAVTDEAVVLAVSSNNNFRFPDWNDVVPSKITKRGFIDLHKAGFGNDRESTEKLTLAFNSFARQTGETVNLRYLEDLTKKLWVVYSQDEKGKAVVLRENGVEYSVFAVMMPMPQAAKNMAAAA